MKVSEMMSGNVISVERGDTVETAAELMEHYNIGALPVCNAHGKLCGIVTDRDVVTRCVAAGRMPKHTRVAHVMSRGVTAADADMDVDDAARLMARMQVRRLPVTSGESLCGMLSLGDLATAGSFPESTFDALEGISARVKDGGKNF